MKRSLNVKKFLKQLRQKYFLKRNKVALKNLIESFETYKETNSAARKELGLETSSWFSLNEIDDKILKNAEKILKTRYSKMDGM